MMARSLLSPVERARVNSPAMILVFLVTNLFVRSSVGSHVGWSSPLEKGKRKRKAKKYVSQRSTILF